MKIFGTVRKNLTCFNKEKPLFHTYQLLNTLEALLALIMLFLYMPIDAVSVKEYMDSIFMTMVGYHRFKQHSVDFLINNEMKIFQGGISIYVAYVSAVFKTEMIFTLMDDIENIVNESKFSGNNRFTSFRIHFFRNIPKNHLIYNHNRIEVSKIKSNLRENKSFRRYNQ